MINKKLDNIHPMLVDKAQKIISMNNLNDEVKVKLISFIEREYMWNDIFAYINSEPLTIDYVFPHFETVDIFIASNPNNELYFVMKIDARDSKFLLENGFKEGDFPFLISRVDIDIIEEVFNSDIIIDHHNRESLKKSLKLLFNELEEWYVLRREGNAFIENVSYSDNFDDFILKVSEKDKDLLFLEKLKRHLYVNLYNIVLSKEEHEIFSELVINRYNNDY